MFKSKWGKWNDISSGAVHETRYLLQARRHKDGRIQFRVQKSDTAWSCDKPTIEQLEKVTYE